MASEIETIDAELPARRGTVRVAGRAVRDGAFMSRQDMTSVGRGHDGKLERGVAHQVSTGAFESLDADLNPDKTMDGSAETLLRGETVDETTNRRSAFWESVTEQILTTLGVVRGLAALPQNTTQILRTEFENASENGLEGFAAFIRVLTSNYVLAKSDTAKEGFIQIQRFTDPKGRVRGTLKGYWGLGNAVPPSEIRRASEDTPRASLRQRLAGLFGGDRGVAATPATTTSPTTGSVLSANRELNPTKEDGKGTVKASVDIFMKAIQSSYELTEAQISELMRLLDAASDIPADKRYSQPRVLGALDKMNILTLSLGQPGDDEDGWHQLMDAEGNPVLNKGNTPIFLAAGSAIHGASMTMEVLAEDEYEEEE